MLSTVVFLLILLILVAMLTARMEGFTSEPASRPDTASPPWWSHLPAVGTSEGFQSEPLLPEHSPLLDFIPDGPSPTDLYNKQPYLLLEDEKKAAQNASTPAVTAQRCYDADFTNEFSKVGTFRQMTNNYKHEYPDTCSALNKDLSMNFY